jgi:hypothetical protein
MGAAHRAALRGVTVDYRELAVWHLRCIIAVRHVNCAEPDPRDIAAVTLWLQENMQQAADCAAGRCEHARPSRPRRPVSVAHPPKPG